MGLGRGLGRVGWSGLLGSVRIGVCLVLLRVSFCPGVWLRLRWIRRVSQMCRML